MKKTFAAVLVISFLIAAFESTITGRVVGVSDGDTVTLLTPEKKQVKIRLQGVDCPERKQAFGTKARQFTSEMIFGKEVRVRITDTDRYGRAVGEVILSDGRSLNHELIRAGLAWHYKQYSKDTQLSELEAEARNNRKGLWADESPVPPWEFRRGTAERIRLAPDGGIREDNQQKTVIFNETSLKYHCLNCPAAAKCTRDCIEIPAYEINQRGGTACKICGGCR